MTEIPKIIHQIWSDVNEPLPSLFKKFSETWIEHHPRWEYILWNNDKMNKFILDYYPQYWDTYNNFAYNVQRWDAIRYLILNKIGGMYVDFDSECLEPLDKLLESRTCCFSLEPKEHAQLYNKDLFFNNALMASIPEHPFMKKIIERVFAYSKKNIFTTLKKKGEDVQETTGPLTLVRLYEEFEEKGSIYLIPSEYVSPFSKDEIKRIQLGEESEELEKKLDKAYSIHYFFNTWLCGTNYKN